MGLSFTKKLTEILNGKITVESQVEKGTLVKVILPFFPPENSDILEAEKGFLKNKLNVASEETDSLIPVVLIVEDSPDIQTYLQAELESQYKILSENNGLDGYKKAVENIPDLIISDVMMPKMDGYKLCKKVKNNEHTCHIPVILLTAKTSEENQTEGLKTGADVYIPKPFSIQVLKAQIESIIENRKKLQEKLAATQHISEIRQENSRQMDNEFLQKVGNYIEENIHEEGFRSENLAEAFHISTRQLSRKLKAISGSTTHEFIIRVKMEKAARLLKESNLNVSEVAFQVGFSEPSNFSRTFTRHFGCSPTKYSGRSGKT